jgi:glyoxylase-like metal-dependent hydrolase (beta-lactamase superfamily II)
MKKLFALSLITICLLAISPAAANKAMKESGVKAVVLKENLYLIEGTQGGNVAFLVTAKGVLVVDSGTSLAEGAQIVKAIRKITQQPIRYVVLTHYHGDHTMGLPAFPETALVIGQHLVARNIRQNNIPRMQKYVESELPANIRKMKDDVEKLKKAKGPELAKAREELKSAEQELAALKTMKPRLPDLTFARSLIINLGGETIHLIYPKPAHTDCNILVLFPRQKVVHMGDMFFHEFLPYIDFQNGASTANWIKQLTKVESWDVTTVIPGHGLFSDKESLKKQIAYLTFLRQAVTNELQKGSGLEAMKTTIVLPAEFKNWQFQSVFPNNIEAVYHEMTTPVQEKEKPMQ